MSGSAQVVQKLSGSAEVVQKLCNVVRLGVNTRSGLQTLSRVLPCPEAGPRPPGFSCRTVVPAVITAWRPSLPVAALFTAGPAALHRARLYKQRRKEQRHAIKRVCGRRERKIIALFFKS